MEIKILQKLNWKLNYLVPFDYLCIFFRFFDGKISQLIFEKTLDLIELCLLSIFYRLSPLSFKNKKKNKKIMNLEISRFLK